MIDTLRIGTRGSALAMRQTEEIRARVARAFPDLRVEIRVLTTKGDRIIDRPLPLVGGKGLFTHELESVMLNGEIDVAVHSLKDLPTELSEGLSIHAVCERVCPFDVLVSADGARLSELKPAAIVGTSSLRRRAQLLHLRPDISVVDLRGNLDTRIKKVEAPGPPDGAILASAGLLRMGWDDRIAEVLDADVMLPSPGQGALAVEGRKDDTQISELFTLLECRETRAAVTAERAVLHGLGGGCHVPIGALGRVENGSVVLEAGVFSLDGKKAIRRSLSGDLEEASQIGTALAKQLLECGADEILKSCNHDLENAREG